MNFAKTLPTRDTPLTDAQELVDRDANGGVVTMVDAEFARTLERELDKLRDQFKREVEDAFKEGVAVGRLQSNKDARTLYLAVSRARRVVDGEVLP